MQAMKQVGRQTSNCTCTPIQANNAELQGDYEKDKSYEFSKCTNITSSSDRPGGFYEQPLNIKLFEAIFCYASFIILNLFGRLRDALAIFDIRQNWFYRKAIKTQGFVPLYQDYEAFYTRHLYRRVCDCWNRPVCSAASAELELVERVSHDNGWSFQYTGATVKAINFGSYNYLGFAEKGGVCFAENNKCISVNGIGICSVRQEIGNCVLHSELESLVATFVGQEDAIAFGMGFATNSMNIPCLVDKHCCIISDELIHTSLILGSRLSGAQIRRFKHNDINSLESKLRDAIIRGHTCTRRPFKKIIIVLEGIYSMEGSIVRLPEVIALKKRYGAYLYVDEAHSIGALGEHGRGVVEYFNVDPRDIDLVMGTFTKSFGSCGGYIAGRKNLIDYIRTYSHSTVYGCSMPSVICQQTITALQIIMGQQMGDEGRRRIRQLIWNTSYFRAHLHRMGFEIIGNKDSPVVPLLLYSPAKVAAFSRKCLELGMATVVVGFPATPLTLARARFCVSAAHTKEMLDKALQILRETADWAFIKTSSSPAPDWYNCMLPVATDSQDHNDVFHKKKS